MRTSTTMLAILLTPVLAWAGDLPSPYKAAPGYDDGTTELGAYCIEKHGNSTCVNNRCYGGKWAKLGHESEQECVQMCVQVAMMQVSQCIKDGKAAWRAAHAK